MKKILLILLFATALFLNLVSQDIAKKKKGKRQEKKVEYEVSFGISWANAKELYYRSSGIDAIIRQYSQYYQLSHSATGKFEENKVFIPVDVSMNYRFSEKWFLNAGIGFSQCPASSQKEYSIGWNEFDENHQYDLNNKITVFMPRVGVGHRYKSLDFFSSLVLGFSQLTHILESIQSEPGAGYEITTTFKVKGISPGMILGVKYRIEFKKKKIGAFAKFEYLLLKVSNLKGTKVSEVITTEGERSSESLDGTLYSFEWNPYGSGWFDYWDIYDSPPSGTTIQNVKKLNLNLSGIRLMVGISF